MQDSTDFDTQLLLRIQLLSDVLGLAPAFHDPIHTDQLHRPTQCDCDCD